MVGVPRSKGCRICVQRRIKCDQTRPKCLRCQKANRDCPGYGQTMKFQDEGPKLRQRFHKEVSSAQLDEQSDDSESLENWPFPQHPEIQTHVADTSLSPAFIDASLARVQQLDFSRCDYSSSWDSESILPLITSCASTSYIDEKSSCMGAMDLMIAPCVFAPNLEQVQLLQSFSTSISPPMQYSLPPVLRHTSRWLDRLLALTGCHPLLDSAVRAVTMTHLGRVHGVQSIIDGSRPYYGKALRYLNIALQDIGLGMASETLSATILLSYYEMFTSSSDTCWIRHAGGAGTLMKLRGPSRHRHGLDSDIFLAYRNAIIIQAVEANTPCFLDQPEWRRVMTEIYEEIRQRGSPGERLGLLDASETFFYEFVQIPGLLYDVRRLPALTKATEGDTAFLVRGIAARAKLHRANLKSIHACLEAELKIHGQLPTTHLSDDTVFPIRYEYANIFIGTLYCGHWTLLILVNRILQKMDCEPGNLDLYAKESAVAARRACESEGFMSTSSFHGPFFLMFALRMAMWALNDKQEKHWIVGKLIALGQSRLPIAIQGKDMPGFHEIRAALEQRIPAIDRRSDLDQMENRAH